MKISCGPTWQERYANRWAQRTVWHPFFTLLPRRVGPRDCRWLETIERIGIPIKARSRYGSVRYELQYTYRAARC